MSSSAYGTALFRRATFTGTNDAYAVQHKTPIDDALKGFGPFDPSGSVLGPRAIQSANTRLADYGLYWNYYNGTVSSLWRDGEQKMALNYCKLVADIGADSLVSGGFQIACPSGNEKIAQYLGRVWDLNGRDSLLQQLASFGTAIGDAFLYVSVEQKDADGNLLPPEQWTTSLTPINPGFCFPVWHPLRPSEMLAALIQLPLINEDGIEVLYTLQISAKELITYHNDRIISKVPNPFGEVNLVHFPNLPAANCQFGSSDIGPITALSDELVQVTNSLRKVIKYFGEPTTVVYGVKVSTLEKGANKVWSGLPETARVETLEMKGDLKASLDYFKLLKASLCELTQIPQMVLDPGESRISNTSGLAMQMMFQPLVEKTRRRRLPYQSGLVRMNRLILKAAEYSKIAVSELADDPKARYENTVLFGSALPKDEQTELDLASKRIAANIWSQAEAIRQVSGVADTERLGTELAADRMQKLVMQAEMQKANSGMPVNLTAAFVGSDVIHEDLVELAKQVAPDDSGEAAVETVPPAE